MSEPHSHRLAEPYRVALFALRRDIVRHSSDEVAELLMDRVQDLADELMRNTQPLVRVPRSIIQAEYEAELALQGRPLGDLVRIPSNTNDEPLVSGIRDTRNNELEPAHHVG